MRVRAKVVACLLLFAGCAVFDPEQAKRNLAELEAQQAPEKAKLDRILVFPGDLNRPYKILGPVRVGSTLFSTCIPDDVRRAALEKYPNVDALIGFMAMGGADVTAAGATYCEATAVEFEK